MTCWVGVTLSTLPIPFWVLSYSFTLPGQSLGLDGVVLWTRRGNLSLCGDTHTHGTELGCCLGWQRGGAAANPQQGRGMPSSRMTWKGLGALLSQRPTLMMSSLSDWHSTRAETSRTRPDTSMAMTLTGMATVRPVSMAVLMISVSCREAGAGGALLHAFLQRHACHPLLPRLRYPLPLGKCKGLPLSSPRLSSDDQPRRMAAEAVPAFQEHPSLPLSQSSQSDINTPSWLVTVLWMVHQPSIPSLNKPPIFLSMCLFLQELGPSGVYSCLHLRWDECFLSDDFQNLTGTTTF